MSDKYRPVKDPTTGKWLPGHPTSQDIEDLKRNRRHDDAANERRRGQQYEDDPWNVPE